MGENSVSTGAIVLFGLSAGLSIPVIGLAIVDALRGDWDAEDIDPDPREVARSLSFIFGIPALGFLAVAGGLIVLGELAPATIGLADPGFIETILGIPLGIGVYCSAWIVVLTFRRVGVEFSEFSNLHPQTLSGLSWYTAGLSVQASAEEVFFRGGLVGAGAIVLGVSAWYLVVPFAVMFGLGHAGRGAGGILVTTVSGVLFGAVFVTFGLLPAALAHVTNNIATTVGKALRADSFAMDQRATDQNRAE